MADGGMGEQVVWVASHIWKPCRNSLDTMTYSPVKHSPDDSLPIHRRILGFDIRWFARATTIDTMRAQEAARK